MFELISSRLSGGGEGFSFSFLVFLFWIFWFHGFDSVLNKEWLEWAPNDGQPSFFCFASGIDFAPGPPWPALSRRRLVSYRLAACKRGGWGGDRQIFIASMSRVVFEGFEWDKSDALPGNDGRNSGPSTGRHLDIEAFRSVLLKREAVRRSSTLEFH